MSMAAGQALMMKLGTQLSAISTSGMSISQIKASLKSTAMSSSMFALKVDSGEKSGWLVKEPVANANPIVINPTSSETPKSFNSKNEAQEYQALYDLYTYNYALSSSSISIVTMMEPNPKSSENVDKMADQLGPDCLTKNQETWSSHTPRKPTPAEFKQVIESKILSFS